MRQLRSSNETLRLSQAVSIAAGRIERTVTGITTPEALAQAEAHAAQLVKDASALRMAIRGEQALARAADRQEQRLRRAL